MRSLRKLRLKGLNLKLQALFLLALVFILNSSLVPRVSAVVITPAYTLTNIAKNPILLQAYHRARFHQNQLETELLALDKKLLMIETRSKHEATYLRDLRNRLDQLKKLSRLELSVEEWHNIATYRDRYKPWIFETFIESRQANPIELGGFHVRQAEASPENEFSIKAHMAFYELIQAEPSEFKF